MTFFGLSNAIRMRHVTMMAQNISFVVNNATISILEAPSLTRRLIHFSTERKYSGGMKGIFMKKPCDSMLPRSLKIERCANA